MTLVQVPTVTHGEVSCSWRWSVSRDANSSEWAAVEPPRRFAPLACTTSIRMIGVGPFVRGGRWTDAAPDTGGRSQDIGDI